MVRKGLASRRIRVMSKIICLSFLFKGARDLCRFLKMAKKFNNNRNNRQQMVSILKMKFYLRTELNLKINMIATSL
jgi:hypothetical protein